MSRAGHAPPVGVACLCVVMALGCASEDDVSFGDPENVVGATSGGVASGGDCEPNLDCDVSFRDDVLPVLVEKARCSAAGCHLTAIGGFAFPETASDARSALISYVFQGADPYVSPCQPASSKLLCNLAVEDGVAQAFGACGSLMPKLLEDAVDDVPLDAAELDALAEWITCGAPDN
jgi:hypothetical protein